MESAAVQRAADGPEPLQEPEGPRERATRLCPHSPVDMAVLGPSIPGGLLWGSEDRDRRMYLNRLSHPPAPPRPRTKMENARHRLLAGGTR